MTTRGTLQLRPATPGAHTRPGDARRKIHFALKVIEQPATRPARPLETP